MIRRDLSNLLLRAAGLHPAVTLTGPRQSGKSTLCRGLFPDKPYANLEAPDTRSFATDDPRAFLAQFPEGAILDLITRLAVEKPPTAAEDEEMKQILLLERRFGLTIHGGEEALAAEGG